MKKVMKRVFTAMGLLVAVAGCSNEGEAVAVNKTVIISGQRYQIPTRYMLPDLPSAMVPRGPEMDEDTGINLDISLLDMGITPLPHTIPTGKAMEVHMLLYGPKAFTDANEYNLNPGAYDAWMGLGNYRRARFIEYDDKVGLYRIYWRQGSRFWEYFEAPPSDTATLQPKWVAGCSVGFHEPKAEDMSNVRCSTNVSFEYGDADLSFTGRYIPEVDKIKAGVRNKIVEWAMQGAKE